MIYTARNGEEYELIRKVNYKLGLFKQLSTGKNYYRSFKYMKRFGEERKKITYGFMYRGNGYGYFKTIGETIWAGKQKALSDRSDLKYKGFGVWKFLNGKAEDCTMYYFD